jgi:excisionase family DNA binding protein
MSDWRFRVEERISPDVMAVARVLAAAGLAARPEPEPADLPPYTVPEAATQLKVDQSTLYRAIQKGRLGAYSVGSGGRAIRIPAAELEAFKARNLIRQVLA